MNQLPEVSLNEIFSYLKFNDLCHLTLTCKSFNEIINNNSPLMDKFRLVYNNDNEINVDLMMKRKYQRIKIQTINERLFKLLEYYGENICEIIIQIFEIEMRDLRAILIKCPNVKQLNIHIEQFSYLDDDLTEPVLKLTLDSLTLNIFDKIIFKVLQISAKTICAETKCLSYYEKFCLVNFLKDQKQLKTLEMVPYCNILFLTDSLANADFQLETLTSDFFLPNFALAYFKNFLINQKSLVRIIENIFNRTTYHCNHVNILRHFENVKELKIPGPFQFSHALPYIEKLTIELYCFSNINQNIHDVFPNVNNLTIELCDRIKFVEVLTEPALEDCLEFKISENVKTLTVKNATVGNDSLFDNDVEIKIENLTIYESDNINWLIECFKNVRIKLKSLTIEETKMKKSEREYLESLTRGENKKIEKLKICMPMKLNENHDYVCDYLMEDDNESDDASKRLNLE